MLRWKKENIGFGLISYTTVAGGFVGQPDAYPALYARIDRVEKYDKKGKKFIDFIVLGSMSYFNGKTLEHINLEYTAHSLKDAKNWVEKEFNDLKNSVL